MTAMERKQDRFAGIIKMKLSPESQKSLICLIIFSLVLLSRPWIGLFYALLVALFFSIMDLAAYFIFFKCRHLWRRMGIYKKLPPGRRFSHRTSLFSRSQRPKD